MGGELQQTIVIVYIEMLKIKRCSALNLNFGVSRCWLRLSHSAFYFDYVLIIPPHFNSHFVKKGDKFYNVNLL